MKSILSRPRKEWIRGALNASVVYLVVAFRSEKDPRLKSDIALFLQEILKIYDAGQVLYLPDENMEIDTIRGRVADTDTTIVSQRAILLVDQLKHWLDDKSEVGQGNTNA